MLRPISCIAENDGILVSDPKKVPMRVEDRRSQRDHVAVKTALASWDGFNPGYSTGKENVVKGKANLESCFLSSHTQSTGNEHRLSADFVNIQ